MGNLSLKLSRLKTSRVFLAGLAVVAGFGEAAGIAWLWLGQPPEGFRVLFYNLAWWPHIFALETLAQIFWSNALLYNNPKGFLKLSLASISFWTVFEIINIVIKNWAYINLPSEAPSLLRWLGYAAAYASVLPAIRSYLDCLRPGQPPEIGFDGKNFSSLVTMSFLLGLGQFFLCVMSPKVFYPLAWSFCFFLTEPLVIYANPRLSYFLHWAHGRWDWTLKTILAGFLVGVTWEFFNWRALAKWVYTLPCQVDVLKVFEMPVLGYIGFGAFALCAMSFSNALLAAAPSRHSQAWKLAWVLAAMVSLFGFAMIDLYTWQR